MQVAEYRDHFAAIRCLEQFDPLGSRDGPLADEFKVLGKRGLGQTKEHVAHVIDEQHVPLVPQGHTDG